MINKKAGFTLAEILINLTIIGVVAVLTLPPLIVNNKERETVVKLKKMHSVLNQALISAINEYGSPESWGFVPSDANETDPIKKAEDYNSRDKVLKRLVPFLKTYKVCYYSDNKCIKDTQNIKARYSLDGTRFREWEPPRVVLADGSTIDVIYMTNPECDLVAGTSIALKHVCGEIFVDTNGKKPPNATGKDVFWFYLTSYGVVPGGIELDNFRSFDNYCNLNKKSEINGYGCTGWVIYNENMNYLKCADLSWNGKKKCKK